MASDLAGQAPPVVLYDANVLYPFHLRNLLIQLGVHGIVSPRWTDAIHDEWIRNLTATGRVDRQRLLRTLDIMKRVLPDADVGSYHYRIGGLVLPDAGDRHVLAAAIEGRAETIVTFNLKHFPAGTLAPFGLKARDPDSFLCALHESDPEAIAATVDAARLNLSRTAPSEKAFLESLCRQRLTAFVARLQKASG
jgi:hypothetical protein